MIYLAGVVLVIVSAVLAWTVVITYHLSAPWRDSHAGRHVMAFTAVLAVVLTLWTVGLLTSAHGTWWDIVRLVAFSGVPAVLAHRLLLLWRLQIRPGIRKEKQRGRTR